MAAACGGGDGDDGGDPTPAAAVSIASPENGATVESTFPVTMEAANFTVEAAGDVTEGAGHFHLIVDAACISPGEQIPADDAHIHLADGAGETELALPAGEHTLCLQAGDGRHAALDLTDEVTITVAGGGEDTTTQPEEGAAIEDWQGSYEGEVVWDCGAAGTHRGTLAADVVILTYEGGRADMEAPMDIAVRAPRVIPWRPVSRSRPMTRTSPGRRCRRRADRAAALPASGGCGVPASRRGRCRRGTPLPGPR